MSFDASGVPAGGPASFEPEPLRPKRRRVDPLAIGIVVTVVAVLVAIAKPWDGAIGGRSPGVGSPPPTAAVGDAEPSNGTPIPSPTADEPLTWADVRSIVSRRERWGIRLIVLGPPEPVPTPVDAPTGSTSPFAEIWSPTDIEVRTSVLGRPTGAIAALGVSFPPDETPLDVRIWRHRAGGGLEWLETHPVDHVPARGAYLYLRGPTDDPGTPWEPGRYRVDALVSGGIRSMEIAIPGLDGIIPEDAEWRSPDRPARVYGEVPLSGLTVGPFAAGRDGTVVESTRPGPTLDAYGAWLDVDSADRGAADSGPAVARMYVRDPTRIGLVLPPARVIHGLGLISVMPVTEDLRATAAMGLASDGTATHITFELPDQAPWRPGVYAISVRWEDSDGMHSGTWHLELLPGPAVDPPVLLTATREWAHLASGPDGILLGTTTPSDGGSGPAGFRLVEITPPGAAAYAGLDGSNLYGCGQTAIHGAPQVIGIVAPGVDLTPVAATILFPFADSGSLAVLTAGDAVPGLVLVAPVQTAEFGGPASYGLRAGPGPDGPGYTICIGLVPPG